jgi:hypothetical protein
MAEQVTKMYARHSNCDGGISHCSQLKAISQLLGSNSSDLLKIRLQNLAYLDKD